MMIILSLTDTLTDVLGLNLIFVPFFFFLIKHYLNMQKL